MLRELELEEGRRLLVTLSGLFQCSDDFRNWIGKFPTGCWTGSIA